MFKNFLMASLFLVLGTVALGQDTGNFAKVRLLGNYTSNTSDNFFPSVGAEAGVKIAEFGGTTVQARGLADYSFTPRYTTILGRDNGRVPTAALAGEAGVRWNIATHAPIGAFVGGSARVEHHFGYADGPRDLVNPVLTAGVRVGYGAEAYVSRIFRGSDRFNRTNFNGYEVGGAYRVAKLGPLSFSIFGDAQQVQFREQDNLGRDYYFETDRSARAGLKFGF